MSKMDEKAIELAARMLAAARRAQTRREKRTQREIAGMISDPLGKAFTVSLTDQCFRTEDNKRAADQVRYLLKKFGVPRFLSFKKRFGLGLFRYFGGFLVPFLKRGLRRETNQVILPGEPAALNRHIQKRQQEGVRVNLNHLGEAILGEEEANRRVELYLRDLQNPLIDYISIKISTICSQINLLAWEDTLEILAGRFRTLLRGAKGKFINLDMEEYRDLHMTVALFKKVLQEPEFHQTSAGIVLQSYLPDSFDIQKELTDFAIQRGGAPIKIRIVKGANLAMEQVEASLQGWEQAPYTSKLEVDANYKRMIRYAFEPERARAVHVGVASHNLFDIAYALLLRSEKGVEEWVEFEMLEGMADHMRRVVQEEAKQMLLYCPVATEEEFQYAIAYLVRRLDENTAPENFLRHSFDLMPGSPEWEEQAERFRESCRLIDQVSSAPRRTAKRKQLFNEPDTDWTVLENRKWKFEWKGVEKVPLVIGGAEVFAERTAEGRDPSTGKVLYHYALADEAQVEAALNCEERALDIGVMASIAEGLRRGRKELICAMIADGGKTVPEADVEVSEAVDFVEYYTRSYKKWMSLESVAFRPKGCVLVTPPWNFPCSIPAGCIAAALVTGNRVIFKPARETVLVGWVLAKLFWQAGVSKRLLQFVTGEDETAGSALVKDPRVNLVVLTGATETAKLMAGMRPGLDLIAETGGKNSMIITRLADRDLAVRHLVQSAFGHSGQKCSACSLAIVEGEVYDSPLFRSQLCDAAASLRVGSAWDLATKINPLILPPGEKLLRGLTTLEEGEEWLLKPKQLAPNLWSPGIKIGVQEGSFTHQTELFGPVLGVMRADNLEHALRLANGNRYGLTAGLHSLDEREHQVWLQKIEAGNCYINRTITGAIVERQPFGGCKESSFGFGMKAGGPNYLVEFMHAADLGKEVNYEKVFKEEFSQTHAMSHLVGQENLLRYIPRKGICLRLSARDKPEDRRRVMEACRICGVKLQVSCDPELKQDPSWVAESEEELLQRKDVKRIRVVSPPSDTLLRGECYLIKKPVVAEGRLELLNYLQEVSISYDYHRYGNLGEKCNY